MDLSGNLLHFIAFAVIVVAAYRLSPTKARKYVLLGFNMVFYYMCSPKYLIVMLFAGLWSFFCGKKMEVAGNRKGAALMGIIPLVALLCAFKYWMPVEELLSGLGGGRIIHLILPIGMSYYILKSISYLADIYYKKINPEKDAVVFLAYVTFFAQIIAGPIQRYKEWHENINAKPSVGIASGYYYIVMGLFMKVVIANRLSTYVTGTFADPSAMGGLQLWLGFFLYAFYIFFDFAGYSNIAIGVTQWFGIDCIKNFKRPYLAVNIKDFWSRWHISLSTWLRDYIYIPLGGNRKGKVRKVINVMITFLVSGMWHGSTLNFIVWGGYHGIFNTIYGGKIQQTGKFKHFANIVLTFLVVSCGWVFFATETLGDSVEYFKGMLTRVSFDMTSIQSAILPFTSDNTCLSFFLIAVAFIVIYILKELNDEFRVVKTNVATSFLWQVFILSSIILFGSFGATSFIYAGF